MALRTLSGASQKGTFFYTSKMQLGERVEGFYVGRKQGKFGPVYILENLDGSLTDVLSSGSLRYHEKDEQTDPSKRLLVGQWTVITKNAQYKAADGKDRVRFLIQQDASRLSPNVTATDIVVEAPATAPLAEEMTQAVKNIQERLQALKTKQA